MTYHIHLHLLIHKRKMELFLSRAQAFVALISILLVSMCRISDCYDPLDPNGNITVTFDILTWTNDGYTARGTIQNFYQYRHVDIPGWKLGWSWANNEVIWSMTGAFAKQTGDCSTFRSEIPHCCMKDPVIADHMPDALPVNRSEDCCHGGVLATWAINPSESFSSFQLTVGNLGQNATIHPPENLTLLAPGPGYTCGPVLNVDPTVSSSIGGRREEQVMRTWKSTCTYSSFLANTAPTCCVSLSTFYTPTITPCPQCSCGCRAADQSTKSCIREGSASTQWSLSHDTDIVQCTDHMCPVRVHWHIKNNYMDHWRVKLTISNYNYMKNYSDWNVLVQHPGLSRSTRVFSFNSTVLPNVGTAEEVALFWGINYYNTELLGADEYQLGSVNSEILLAKELDTFTLQNGWAFPRRIYFNGENCEMPPPDTFPTLPNGCSSLKPGHPRFFIVLVICLTIKTLVIWF